MKVLPGEEAGRNAQAVSETHRLPGGQVVWLFVYVQEVRVQATQQPTQARVEMQVKVTVEGHRGDQQLVALGMHPLQAGDAAAIPPGGRNDDGQFHPWQARQFFQLALVDADDTRFGDQNHTHGNGPASLWLRGHYTLHGCV